MTMMFHQKKICFVCRKESSHPIIASTNAFGSPDLDTRPPEGKRSTMHCWVEVCPHCGYAASDISEETSVPRAFLNSRVYRECDGNLFLSALAQDFFRQYLLARKEGNLQTSFFALLHAAWACDDNNETYGAIRCRKLAITQLEQWMATPERNVDDAALLLMKADLLRRSRDFSAVIDQFEGKAMEHPFHQQVIDFQVDRAKQEDAGCYRIDQITSR